MDEKKKMKLFLRIATAAGVIAFLSMFVAVLPIGAGLVLGVIAIGGIVLATLALLLTLFAIREAYTGIVLFFASWLDVIREIGKISITYLLIPASVVSMCFAVIAIVFAALYRSLKKKMEAREGYTLPPRPGLPPADPLIRRRGQIKEYKRQTKAYNKTLPKAGMAPFVLGILSLVVCVAALIVVYGGLLPKLGF